MRYTYTTCFARSWIDFQIDAVETMCFFLFLMAEWLDVCAFGLSLLIATNTNTGT